MQWQMYVCISSMDIRDNTKTNWIDVNAFYVMSTQEVWKKKSVSPSSQRSHFIHNVLYMHIKSWSAYRQQTMSFIIIIELFFSIRWKFTVFNFILNEKIHSFTLSGLFCLQNKMPTSANLTPLKFKIKIKSVIQMSEKKKMNNEWILNSCLVIFFSQRILYQINSIQSFRNLFVIFRLRTTNYNLLCEIR